MSKGGRHADNVQGGGRHADNVQGGGACECLHRPHLGNPVSTPGIIFLDIVLSTNLPVD